MDWNGEVHGSKDTPVLWSEVAEMGWVELHCGEVLSKEKIGGLQCKGEGF